MKIKANAKDCNMWLHKTFLEFKIYITHIFYSHSNKKVDNLFLFIYLSIATYNL